jgi:lysophospholipase L1-like esterase
MGVERVKLRDRGAGRLSNGPEGQCSMKRLSPAIVAATLIISMLGGIPAAHAGGGSASYLALGTSLTVGYQPGQGVTTNGYVDDLFETMRQQIPGLTLRNVGCPGETTRSMINGEHSMCHYAAGSQLDAAVAFLDARPGQVAFITLEVGANDVVDRCLNDTYRLDRACATDVLPRLHDRLTQIVDALTAAAPGVPIVSMTYYDPLLGLWGLVPGGRALARADQRVWTTMNTMFASAYSDAAVTVADVAATFQVDDFTDPVVVPGRGELPVNVANTCRWTWFCTPRFAGDVHTNRTGYRKIAETFEQELQALLP